MMICFYSIFLGNLEEHYHDGPMGVPTSATSNWALPHAWNGFVQHIHILNKQ